MTPKRKRPKSVNHRRYPKSATAKRKMPGSIFQIKVEEDRYKLERKKFSKFIKKKSKFLSAYSNGPLRMQQVKGKNAELKENFALKIQKVWRGYRVRNKYAEGTKDHYDLIMARKARIRRKILLRKKSKKQRLLEEIEKRENLQPQTGVNGIS
jgi:hypothetical protein